MVSNWYAPSLTSLQEASTADWPLHDITQLLKTGLSSRAATAGPMADVVSQSLQRHPARVGLAHGKPALLQDLPKRTPDGLLIVNQEHGCHGLAVSVLRWRDPQLRKKH